MAKNYLKTLIRLNQDNENMVSQIYDATRIKLFTRNRHMRAGETRTINLTMVEDFEYFEGREVVPEKWSRNPLVFQGAYINIHRDKNGHYQIALRKIELNKTCNVVRIGNAIITELLNAKKLLGVCRK